MRAWVEAFAISLLGAVIVGVVVTALLVSMLTVRNLKHDVTLEFAHPRPGFTYFLVCRDEYAIAERITLTDDRTVRVNSDKLFYRSTIQPLYLCAMPSDVAKDFNENSSDFDGYPNRTKLHDWFDKPEVKTKLRWSGELGEIPVSVWGFWNPQHTIVRRYRVSHTPAELKVDLVEDRVVNSWRNILVTCGWGSFALLVAGGMWVWLFLRWRRAYC